MQISNSNCETTSHIYRLNYTKSLSCWHIQQSCPKASGAETQRFNTVNEEVHDWTRFCDSCVHTASYFHKIYFAALVLHVELINQTGYRLLNITASRYAIFQNSYLLHLSYGKISPGNLTFKLLWMFVLTVQSYSLILSIRNGTRQPGGLQCRVMSSHISTDHLVLASLPGMSMREL